MTSGQVKINTRQDCRLCGSTLLHKLLTFERVPYNQVLVKSDLGREWHYPMSIHQCERCLAVQSLHNIEFSSFYDQYGYTASSSNSNNQYFDLLHSFCTEALGISEGSTVLEVGASDGSFLSRFEMQGCRVLGFEPSESLARLARQRGLNVKGELFGAESLGGLADFVSQTDLIIILHTLDHLPDPLTFLRTAFNLLRPDSGHLLIEVHDLDQLIENSESAIFSHEHTIFLNLPTIEMLLKRAGFQMLAANFLPGMPQRGSSMLVLARAVQRAQTDQSERGTSRAPTEDSNEETAKLPKRYNISDFDHYFVSNYQRLRQYVESKIVLGQRLAAYGGWGRGAIALAMSGLTGEHFCFAVDRNPSIQGLFTPISHLEIVSPNAITIASVEEVIVFNHGYIAEIRQSLRKFIEDGGLVTSILDIV